MVCVGEGERHVLFHMKVKFSKVYKNNELNNTELLNIFPWSCKFAAKTKYGKYSVPDFYVTNPLVLTSLWL